MDTSIASIIKGNHILAQLQRQDIAKLLPHITEVTLKKGEVLFTKGQETKQIYLLVKGSVSWKNDNVTSDITQGFLGEEAALAMSKYTASVMATTDTYVISFPKFITEKLLKHYPSIQNDLHHSFLRHFCSNKVDQTTKNIDPVHTDETWLKTVGWLLTMSLPLGSFFIGEYYHWPWNINLFLGIFFATLSMWVFRLVPEFVPAFFLVIVTLILGLVPPSEILSGFMSSSFFMALSIFGLGAVLVASGMVYRVALHLLYNAPATSFWYSFALFITGAFLTPVLPSANGRISLITPLLLEISESTHAHGKGKRFTQMATFAFVGTSLLSAAFLSSKSINLVVYGMLPVQVQNQFHWSAWTLTALVFAAVLIVGFLLLSHLFFRGMKTTPLSKQQVKSQLDVIGPMSTHEWLAALGIGFFLIGILTSSIHKVNPSWIGLAILYAYLVLGSLNKKDFRQQIDWPFLILLAGMVGMANTISYLELDAMLGNQLKFVAQYMQDNLALLVFIVAILVYIVRLFIPNNATVAVLATLLIPMAEIIGISPWVIVFMLLVFSDGWFFPYQSTYYLLFIEQLGEGHGFNSRYFLIFNALTNLLRVLAVYASIPYWKYLGII